MKINPVKSGAKGISSQSNGASQLEPGVYTKRSNPIPSSPNKSSVHDLGFGTKRGGDAYGSLQGGRGKK